MLPLERLEGRTLLSAGSLDPTFGRGGFTTTDLPLDQATANATSAVVDASGRIVVAGLVLDADGNAMTVLARYRPDGRLDSTFGAGGTIKAPIVGHDVLLAIRPAVAIDPAGEILVAGALAQPPDPYGNAVDDFAVARYMPSGRLDAGFGTGGVASVNIGFDAGGTVLATDDAPSGIAIQPDGKIVVSGTTSGDPFAFSFNPEYAVVRLNPDGSLDTNFGQSGRAVAAPFAGDFTASYANALALGPDGRIVVAGTTTQSDGSSWDYTTVRFTDGGILDAGFAGGGIFDGGFASSFRPALDTPVVVQPDSKIVLGELTPGKFKILRLNVDGSSDVGFGAGGVVTTPVTPRARLTALALQPDGKIVAAGWNVTTGADPRSDFVLARYSGTDGSLDASFGGGGVVLVNPPVDHDQASAVALQPDGKIIVAGRSSAPRLQLQNGTDLEVARFDAAGGLDATFGSGGRVTTRFSGSRNDSASATAVLPDGKILVAGSTSWSGPTFFGGSSFGLAEYLPNGKLNPSFGREGLAVTSFGGTNDTASAIALQPDGRIVVAGTTAFLDPDTGQTLQDFALARFNRDGSLDRSFGSGGLVKIDLGDSQDVATGVAIQPDGKIVVVGAAGSFDRSFGAVRLNAGGSLDTSFGVGGIVITAFPGDAAANAVAIQPDGKILVGGLATAADFSPEWALVRYNPDGSLDPGFGTSGVAALANSPSGVASLAIQPDGKIVAVGTGTESGDFGIANVFQVARFTTAGQLDPSFGSGGVVQTDLTPAGSDLGGPNNSEATSVVIQADGKIVVGGATSNPGYSPNYVATPNTVALVRYYPDGSLDPGFGTGGVTITSLVDAPATGYSPSSDVSLVLQPDGKIVASFSTPANAYGGSDFGVTRFDAGPGRRARDPRRGDERSTSEGSSPTDQGATGASGAGPLQVGGTASAALPARALPRQGTLKQSHHSSPVGTRTNPHPIRGQGLLALDLGLDALYRGSSRASGFRGQSRL